MKKSVLYITALSTTLTLTWMTPVIARADQAPASLVLEVGKGSVSEAFSAIAGEIAEETSSEIEKTTRAGSGTNSGARQELVNYALQFVGGRYRAGGNDPHTGADCSGFVKYVMQNGAGVSMNRSSREQACQGMVISASQMQPGDLLFYGGGSGINHVAMYIGDGQVVHASTYSTGIKTSAWNYRAPVKIVNVLG